MAIEISFSTTKKNIQNYKFLCYNNTFNVIDAKREKKKFHPQKPFVGLDNNNYLFMNHFFARKKNITFSNNKQKKHKHIHRNHQTKIIILDRYSIAVMFW